jgi:hypothetical protein
MVPENNRDQKGGSLGSKPTPQFFHERITHLKGSDSLMLLQQNAFDARYKFNKNE